MSILRKLIGGAFTTFIFSSVGSAQVDAKVRHLKNVTEFTYTVENLESSTQHLITFELTLPRKSSLRDISGPANWGGFYDEEVAVVSWSSMRDEVETKPGQAASFSFRSPLSEGTQEYAVFGFDSPTRDGKVLYGKVAGPKGDWPGAPSVNTGVVVNNPRQQGR